MRLREWRRTCTACPEQWEGTLEDGRVVYLRHRHGYGSIAVGRDIDEAVDADYSGRGQGRVLLAWHDWPDTPEVGDGGYGDLPGSDALLGILYLAGIEPPLL